MSSQIKIEKVVIQIGSTEVSLTLDQIKELRLALDSLVQKEFIPSLVPYPVYPSKPTYEPFWWGTRYTSDTLYLSTTC